MVEDTRARHAQCQCSCLLRGSAEHPRRPKPTGGEFRARAAISKGGASAGDLYCGGWELVGSRVSCLGSLSASSWRLHSNIQPSKSEDEGKSMKINDNQRKTMKINEHHLTRALCQLLGKSRSALMLLRSESQGRWILQIHHGSARRISWSWGS